MSVVVDRQLALRFCCLPARALAAGERFDAVVGDSAQASNRAGRPAQPT